MFNVTIYNDEKASLKIVIGYINYVVGNCKLKFCGDSNLVISRKLTFVVFLFLDGNRRLAPIRPTKLTV